MIDFSKMPAVYWSEETKISYLQRRIIVHSLLYYQLNFNIVSDAFYDSLARQLVKMKKENPKAFAKSKYFYAMKDFDGSTGFNLYNRLCTKDRDYLMSIATMLKKQKEKK